jgi:MoaA/NifB/PqqE/SkfB family radical SAM enzyme
MDIGSHIALLKAAAGILHGRRTFGGPLHAVLSLTGRCNIRCIHCYFYSELAELPNVLEVRHARMHDGPLPDRERIRRLQRQDWDGEAIRSITDELVRMGTRTFMLTGGEPFLHPHLLSAVARVKSANKHCLIYTNGTLIDRPTADELIGLGCDELRISVLAGTEDTYAEVHPGIPAGTFGRLKEILAYMAERKAALGKTTPFITIVFIVFSGNCGDILPFARLADAVGADQAVFRPVDDVGDAGLARVVPSLEEAALARAQLAEAAPYLDRRGIRHNIPLFLSVFNRRIDTSALYRAIPCYFGWVWTRVNSDGLVYPCCRCYKPMGNAFEKPLREIWNGIPYRRFRERAIRLNRDGPRPESCNCDTCSHFTGNLRVYRAFHPLGRGKLKDISPELKDHI